jgi:plasmid stabilization system protein ParE
MKILWSTQARRDLRAIHDFIGRDSEHYAKLQIE